MNSYIGLNTLFISLNISFDLPKFDFGISNILNKLFSNPLLLYSLEPMIESIIFFVFWIAETSIEDILTEYSVKVSISLKIF